MSGNEQRLAGACGNYCGSCPIFRAFHDHDGQRQFEVSFHTRCTLDKIKCEGCGSNDRFILSNRCNFRECAKSRGLGSCALCGEYPCEMLSAFYGSGSQYHREASGNCLRIRETGLDRWLGEMAEKCCCTRCGASLTVGDRSCRACGHQRSA
jgi:hypothetical protein